MKHVSVTYSPVSRQWETMIDGNQTRRVIHRGPKADCILHGIWESKTLNQPLFLFGKDGESSKRILP